MAPRFQPLYETQRHQAGRAAALVGLAVVLTLVWAVAPAQATTQTFTFTGAEQTFTVPVGVFHVHIVAIGGSGGASDLAGGAAAQVSGDLEVTPGQTLYVEVGGGGQNGGLIGGAGGFNGGGAAGNTEGGGGGGASDVRTSPRLAGLSPEDRLIVAAGGGGTGSGGAMGAGGAGGSAGKAGAEAPSSGNHGGDEGTQSTGGSGGLGAGESGEEGQLGLGGQGGGNSGSSEGGSGGGGGGGYYGGGGGSGGVTFGGGGGGGGSSLVPPGGSLELALPTSQPQIQISYNPPPSVAVSFPANGATYTQGEAVSAVYFCNAGEGTGLKVCAGTVANGALFDTTTLGQHTFTVEAEDTDGGKATQSVTYTVLAPPIVPDTIIDSHPKKTTKTTKKKVRVKFSFSSDPTGATFKCKLDKGAFVPCVSPKTYKVKSGRHTFSVEAANSVGTDPTPATFSFKVKKKR